MAKTAGAEQVGARTARPPTREASLILLAKSAFSQPTQTSPAACLADEPSALRLTCCAPASFKEMKIFKITVFVIMFLPLAVLTQTNVPSRAPFVLEMPEISAARHTAPIIRLRNKDVPSLKFRVVEPFASEIDYGKIIVTLNGSGVNRGCEKKADAEGKIVLCGRREDRLGGYELQAGKNVIEIKATDRKGREFYASYILVLGDKTAAIDKPEIASGKAEVFRGRKFAVIIGVSDYKFQDAGLKNLNYADDDARAIAAFLQTPAGGGFASSDIKLLLNADASLLAVRSALLETAKRARADDLIFIFIAGHGAPDPVASQNLYFLLTDSKVADMPNTAFPMAELKQILDTQVYAKRVLVLIDTCHSAGVNQKTKTLVTTRDLVQEGDENNISNFFLTNQLFKQTGRAVITSSDVNEVSQESAKWGNHGVFTWALLNGLKGKADLNGDKFITAGELFQFTRASVQKATNFQQNPIALPGSSVNLALAMVGNESKNEIPNSVFNTPHVVADNHTNNDIDNFPSKTSSLKKLAWHFLKTESLEKARLALEMAKEEEYIEYLGRVSRQQLEKTSFYQGKQGYYFRNVSYKDQNCEKDYQTLSNELTTLAAEANLLKNKIRNSLETNRLNEIKSQLDCLGEAYHKVLDDIFTKAQNTEDEIIKYYQIPKLRSFMTSLRKLSSMNGQAVVLYTLTIEDEYWILLVSPDLILAKSKPLKSNDLTRKVANFRNALQNTSVDPKPLAVELYRDLLEPLAADLDKLNAKILVWSLDRELRYLPVAALHDGNQYLVEKFNQVIYTPAAPSRWNEDVPSNLSSIGFGVSDGQPPLPGVLNELTGIFGNSSKGILKGRFYTNNEFTEKTLRNEINEGIPNGYLSLHIASHFYLIPGKNFKTDSYLLLGNNGKLTIEKMDSFLNLFDGIHLLTLSTCSTAFATNNSNGNEFESFAVLAQEQGAKSILATLWKVNDISTSEFMKKFYEKWQVSPSIAKVEAMRQAQLDLMNGKYNEPESKRNRGVKDLVIVIEKALPAYKKDSNAPYEHPFYWAPFVLIGNWR
jgi:CHAT domain-containing protein/uncharacterized caspase-like protein